SYLSVEAIVRAAQAVRADAVHPGYGFLSENAGLARRCRETDILFIGPTEKQLKSVGDKLAARRLAARAGLPLIPGGPIATVRRAQALARRVGWPVLIKAVGGGGGRGMKPVHDPAQLATAFELAHSEANAAFGDARLYLERLVPSGRHVEVQLLGDGAEVIHLGDRDCSIQRRYQKLLEEAPAPLIPDDLRRQMHEAALQFGRHLKYRGLGTVEFLLDSERREFYFLEMNARIQVEHPVTEAITGLDLVEEQIAVAQGQPLRLGQAAVSFSGHAIECRINAEDCRHDFQPSPGVVSRAIFPAGSEIRVDTHIESGSRVPALYDSLLAKIIAHGRDRSEALAHMRAALATCVLQGVATNLALHVALLEQAEFARGGLDTAYLPCHLQRLLPATAA
ncbi:MAG TPA: biotin carboxylase N-terminal domain-containing protein, partial [Steroidobacteraceae bacterium]|nr:biotin carboxylase N-terminal domain-containing protein [Steroidobacteraceae bacterium]